MKQKLNKFISKNKITIITLLTLLLVALPHLIKSWQLIFGKITTYQETLGHKRIDRESKKWDEIFSEYKITSLEHKSYIYQGKVFTIVEISPDTIQYLEYLRNIKECQSISEESLKPPYNPSTQTFNIDYDKFKPSSRGGPPKYCSYDIYAPSFSSFLNEVDAVIKLASDKNLSVIKQTLKENNNFLDFVQTEVINFSPVSYLQAEKIGGKCWQSIASTSDNAYRCLGGDNTIYDPCFQIGNQEVACYSDPERPAIVVIKTAEILIGSKSNEHSSLPWVAVLEGGDKCYIMTGTGVVIRGEVYHLSCIIGKDQDFFGEITTADSYPWQMRLVSSKKDIVDTSTKIMTVYK